MASRAAEQSESYPRPLGAPRLEPFNPRAHMDREAAGIVERGELFKGDNLFKVSASIVRQDQRRILGEQVQAEARVLEEANETNAASDAPAPEYCIELGDAVRIERERVEIFSPRFTIGALADFEQDLRLDGINPAGIGIRRNAAGGILGIVILLEPDREGGR